MMILAYLRSVDRWCRARRHGPVATQRRSTSTEQLFCANGVASTSKRRERSSLTPFARFSSHHLYYRRHSSGYSHTYQPFSTLPGSSFLLAPSCAPLVLFPASSRCLRRWLRPRGCHHRGTCADSPIRQNSPRRAARIGKNEPREKEEATRGV